MNEEEKVKQHLIKNMILNLITFSIIFYILGTVIYSKFINTVYLSADTELEQSIFGESERRNELGPRGDIRQEMNDIVENQEQNPRLIYIVRNENGDILEDNKLNYRLNDVFTNIEFDKNEINVIYNIVVNGQYKYRGINYQSNDGTYMQVLINVDAENDIIEQFKATLVITFAVSVILIVIASYILSTKTLKPIIISWKKQTQFVQDASHELRTPITIIQAKQEKLLEDPESKIIEHAEDISITLKETQRLTRLIKDLMELARSDSKGLEINKEKFNFDEEIQSIITLYNDVSEGQEKSLIVDLNYKEDIFADPNKIKELLIILLDNSFKYTEKGDKVTVKTYKKDNKCVLEVIDTGIGISKEAQDHIFERFYREEKSRSREKGGMGLRIVYCL